MRLLQGDETRGVGGLVRMGTVEEAGRAVEALGKPSALGGAMVVRYADSPEEKLRCANCNQAGSIPTYAKYQLEKL